MQYLGPIVLFTALLYALYIAIGIRVRIVRKDRKPMRWDDWLRVAAYFTIFVALAWSTFQLILLLLRLR